jgi:hypothetical protein
MADVLEFGLKLVDQFSPSALGASKATSDLTSQLEKSRRALADEEKGFASAKSTLAAYSAQLRLANQLGDVEGHQKFTALIGDQQKKVFDLGSFMVAHRPIAQGYIQGLESEAKAATAADASNAAFLEGLEGLAGPIGAVVAGVGALGLAFVGLTIEGAKLAIEQVELRQQLETTFDALGEGPGAGKATLELFDSLEGPLGQTRDKLADWTKTYEALGITDLSGIRYQLTATASAQAIMGDTGAAAYENITKKVQEAIETHHGLKIADKGLAALGATGANVSDVAAKLGLSAGELRNQLKAGTVDAQQFGDALSAAIIEKGQGPLENLRGDVGTILGHAHESFLKLFDGVDPKPFTDQMQSLATILDDQSPSAQAAKAAITGFLDEVFKIGSEGLPIVKHFFLDLEIAGLRSYIVLKPAIQQWKDLGGTSATIGALSITFKLMAGSIESAAIATAYLVRGLAAATSFGISLSGIDGGKGFAQGLAQDKPGETAGTKLADDTTKAVRDRLEIHSPSRVLFGLGVNTGRGFTGGIQNERPNVDRAASSLGFAAVSGTAYASAPPSNANAGASSSSGGGSVTVNVQPGAIQITGGSGQSALELTETAVAILFERYALQRGVAA